jgi:hypothetical protein
MAAAPPKTPELQIPCDFGNKFLWKQLTSTQKRGRISARSREIQRCWAVRHEVRPFMPLECATPKWNPDSHNEHSLPSLGISRLTIRKRG